MSGPTFALDLAQIPTPVAYEEDNLSKQAEQAEQTPDGCDCDCECLRRSLSHETQIIDPPCAEEDLHGHDRGIFEDAWQAVAGWLARAGSQGADDLYGGCQAAGAG